MGNSRSSARVAELERQVAELKKMIETQHNVKEHVVTQVVEESIDLYVEDMLQKHRIQYLPEFVERSLYKNIFTLLMTFLDSVVSKNQINLVGHKITFKLESQQ